MKKFSLIILVLLCTFGLASQAVAQGLPSGLSVTNVGADELDVTFDVELNTVYPFYYAAPIGRLGTQFYTPTFAGYYGLATMTNPAINAIDYGDGSSPVGATTVPLATAGAPPGTPNTFRGSFTHTFPAAGDYTVTVGKNSFLGPVGSTIYPVTTGNIVSQNTIGFSQYSSFYGTTVNFTTVLTFPFALGVTNSTALTSGAFPSATPVVEVPTASSTGLIALMILLAGFGVALLRR